MQTKYVWIIAILANVLIVSSSYGERSKRDLAFIKNIIANIFGYNNYNRILTNENMKILYPKRYYPVFMNPMPDPTFNRNIYQASLPKILIPNNMVMQPVINLGGQNVPYITAFDERNYIRKYANLDSSQFYGNMPRVIPIPNYNRVEVPLARCNDETPVSYKKNLTNDRTEEVSSSLSKHETHKVEDIQSLRDSEEKNKDVDVHKLASSESSQFKKSVETTPERPVQKSQSSETSTTSASPTTHGVPTESTFYTSTTSTTELLQISTSKSSNFTNVYELTKVNMPTISTTLTTPLPTSPQTFTNVPKKETDEQINIPIKKKEEEITSTSTTVSPTTLTDYKQPNNKDEMNKNSNRGKKNLTFTEPIRTLFAYKTVDNNKPNEDTVFKMEDIEYLKGSESQDDLSAQPSMFNHVIDVLNSIAPIRGKVLNPPNIYIPQGTDATLKEIDTEDMEINNQPTEFSASDSEELDYLNRSPIVLEEPSYGSNQEEVSQNEAKESQEDFSWIMSSESEREISRGDVPDV